MFKNISKFISIGVASVTLCGLLAGCSSSSGDGNQVVYCHPVDTSQAADYIEIVLGDDNKTIEQYTYKKHINKDYIQAVVDLDNEEGGTETVDSIYQMYVDSYQALYAQYVEENTNVSWISYTYKEDETNKSIDFVLSFDFTDENFTLNKTTRQYLKSTMPWKYFYNKDEQKLEYQDILEDDFAETGIQITCDTNTESIKDTLHYKTFVKWQKATGKSSDSSDSD